MKILKENLFNNFSHVYIENDVLEHPLTQKILKQYKDSVIIKINHYKDVFCRPRQNIEAQKMSKKLIIAKKTNNLIYKGAPVCQSFGNEHFYYTSCIMNCIYNCDYCYLQGMYPSADIVLFVNIEDVFEETLRLIKKHPVYLCVSYDTDIAALEGLTGYTSRWIEFARENDKDFKIEIRTKSAHTKLWKQLNPSDNVILAYTLSPEEIISKNENGTPSLIQRIESINTALNNGFKVRLCFDPTIYCSDFERIYGQMLDYVADNIDFSSIEDVSLGTFRVSQDYLKKMRKNNRQSAVVNYPYENSDGVYHYPKEILKGMMSFMTNRLCEYIDEDKIYKWE